MTKKMQKAQNIIIEKCVDDIVGYIEEEVLCSTEVQPEISNEWKKDIKRKLSKLIFDHTILIDFKNDGQI